MDYGMLIRQAWAVTWRYRFLWVLGVLAGGAVGMPTLNGGNGSSGWRADRGDVERLSPSVAAAGEQLVSWAAVNAGLLIVLAAAGVVLMVGLFVLSFVAQGGMARATADLATGHTSSLGRAWGAGVHLFWRYVGLWLLLIGAALAIGATVAAVVATVAVAVATGQVGAGIGVAGLAAAAVIVGFVVYMLRLTRAATVPRWLIVIGSALFALPVFTVFIAIALTLSIVVAFAQRAIAVEDVGPIDALRSAWRLTRTHLGESLLTWLINVGLALASGIAFIVGVLGAVVVLGGGGALVFAVAGFTAPTFAYIGVGAAVLLVGVLTLAGIANTFFWTFWTLVYLRFSGRAGAPAGA